MAELDQIGVTDGQASSGTGEVPTLAPVRDAVLATNALLGAIDGAKETDPDAASATLLALLRGILETSAPNFAAGTAGTPSADVMTVQGGSGVTPLAVNHASTGIGHGVTTVTTAGTDVALAGSTAAKWVTVQAQTDNTGWIAVGATGVDATEATGNGVLLDAGESITLLVDNLADVFIDSTVNGEGVRYTYGI